MGVQERRQRFATGGTAIAVAMGIMNVATYAFTLLAAQFLGPDRYGAFVAVLNFLLVVSVGSLGLQATAARRIAADPRHSAQIEESIMRVGWRVSALLGVLFLLGAPIVNWLLKLDSMPVALLMAACTVPITFMGAQAGTLQGERRWGALGLVYLAAGVPRLAVGTGLLVWQPTEFNAVLGCFAGYVAPVMVGFWALRGRQRPHRRIARHRGLAVVKESIHNSQALLAFFTLSSVDIIVARNVLDAGSSGLYAAGLIVTKAMLFLPQFVVVVAFPDMSSPAARKRALTRSLGLVAAIGVLGSAGAWLLSDLAIMFAGGSKFAEVQDRLWLFAVLGTMLSMLQLLVYAVLARRGRRSIYFVWLGLAAMVGLGLTTSTLNGLLGVVLAVDATLLAFLLAMSLLPGRDRQIEGSGLESVHPPV